MSLLSSNPNKAARDFVRRMYGPNFLAENLIEIQGSGGQRKSAAVSDVDKIKSKLWKMTDCQFN
jgi:hypothetical protein